jgi:hypothetical protein
MLDCLSDAKLQRQAPEDISRSPRQKEFIAAAARLFSARGYHAVGIDEISTELGLSGPAINAWIVVENLNSLKEITPSHCEVAAGDHRREDIGAVPMPQERPRFAMLPVEHRQGVN